MSGRLQTALTPSAGFFQARDRSLVAAVWLFAVAMAVAALVVVGGATRLTGSGLSITQWKPLTGAFPPMSAAAWADAFHRYQATTQYQLVNRGMSLAAFKSIFWWEWVHRLLARGVGILFAAPFAALLVARRLPGRLVWPCIALLALGGLQGLVGWWMVTSGLEGRLAVAPERLAMHLGLALALMCALIWTALEAWAGLASPTQPRRGAWRLASAVFAAGVFLQCLLGALVAGNQAGLTNNDWPLMSGRLLPADYWQGALWTTLAHGAAAVQFNHRLLAYGLLILALALAIGGWRSRLAPRMLRILGLATAGIAAMQVALGVAVLISGVALPLAMLHQAVATILLADATILAWRARRT